MHLNYIHQAWDPVSHDPTSNCLLMRHPEPNMILPYHIVGAR